MRRRSIPAILALLVAAAPVGAEVLDRIVAIVDGSFIVTLSDIRKERALQTALGAKTATDAEVLESLLERRLIEEQLAQYRNIPIDDAAIDARLRTLTPRPDVSTADLRAAVAGELRRFEFLAQRFGQFVQVTDAEARTYFEEVLVPELRRTDAVIPSLEEGMALVRPNVAAEKLNQEVSAWLKDLRGRSRVEKISH
jgi:hypothetical protein